jgi:hypothetical protein
MLRSMSDHALIAMLIVAAFLVGVAGLVVLGLMLRESQRLTRAVAGWSIRRATGCARFSADSSRNRTLRPGYSGPLANQRRGSAARTRAVGSPSSRRTMLVPFTSETHL